MLGEQCESAAYWKKCGDDAIAHGIKGVIIMVRIILLLIIGLTILIQSEGCPLGLLVR